MTHNFKNTVTIAITIEMKLFHKKGLSYTNNIFQINTPKSNTMKFEILILTIMIQYPQSQNQMN